MSIFCRLNLIRGEYIAHCLFGLGLLSFCVLTLVPFYLDFFLTDYNQSRWGQIIFLSCLSVACFTKKKVEIPAWLMSILFLSFASTLFADNFYFSYLGMSHWFLLIVGTFLIFSSIERTYIAVAIRVFLYSYAFYLVLAVMNILFAFWNFDGLKKELIYPFGDNVRFFNQWQAFMIPFFIFFQDKNRILMIAGLFISFLLLFIGGARGLLVSLLVMLFFMSFFSVLRVHVKKTLLILITSYVFVVALEMLMPASSQEHTSVFRSAGSSGRLHMWIGIVNDLKWSSIFIGVGPLGYAYESFDGIRAHPHNSIFMLLYEVGFIAVCLVLFFLFKLYSALYRERNVFSDPYATPVCLGLLCAAVYSLFTGILMMPLPQVLCVIFLGYLLKEVKLDFSRTITLSVGVKRLVLLPVVIIYIALSSYSYLFSVSDEAEHRSPGFWINGAPFRI